MNYYHLILNIVDYSDFCKGRVYDEDFIDYIESHLDKDHYEHNFKVKSERTRNWYDVKINNNADKIYSVNCTCKQFDSFSTCKHVAAVLYNYITNLCTYEYIDQLKVSRSILKDFYSKSKEQHIKQKLNIAIEFEKQNNGVAFKLSIGDNKLYKLSTERKFLDFMTAFRENGEYEFGKKLTYNPDNYYFSKEDLTILNFLFGYNRTGYNYYSTNPFVLTNREFESLLNLLDGRPFSIVNYGTIKHVLKGIPTNYVLTQNETNYLLDVNDLSEYRFWGSDFIYVLYKDGLYILDNEEANYFKLLEKNRIHTITFEKRDLNKFSNGLLRKIKNNLTISEEVKGIEINTKPNINLYFDITSELSCNPQFEYGGKVVDFFSNANILRDKDIEEEVVNEIMNYGFYEKNQKFVIEDEDCIYGFLENDLPKLSEKYNVFTSKKIDATSIKRNLSVNSNFSIGKDGIMSYNFGIEGINQEELGDIFKALKAKKRYYKLKNNSVISFENNDEVNELNSIINDLDITNKDITTGNVQLPKYRALYIDSLKNNRYKSIKTNNLFDEFINNFKKYKDIQIEFDENDAKILRDYQKEGVKWLTTIYKCDFGGILADEMGLGKSLQTISFIKQILQEKKDAKIIIVAPTSLIYNWQKEFEKFAPDLKYVVVAETKSKRKEILEHKDDYNIFITTYGLIRNDNDEYENMYFELCIIDEAQAIKNYQAGMTKEVKKIQAKCKIALTGTPVENNVTELWSIFDFIMPGYLNSVLKFREKYNVKDVQEDDLKIVKNLSYQVSPFILRRKKIDVAKSLPEKIESKVYIDLPEKQKMLYLNELNSTKQELDEMIGAEGFQKARMKILQLLMRLRQICIDPSVMYENYDGDSVKIEELLNIVKENISNGHKILIFSSFKRILDHVQSVFKDNSISTFMIDGSVKSKERMAMVEAFNKDDTNCFLITLKAGGTGLNLVGADVVIHLDIWWNPQVENQATDRAHRIGQTKNVSVIKLITKGTIEERIIELQEKKKILSDNLIEGKQDSNTLSSLTEKDIKDLLAYND